MIKSYRIFRNDNDKSTKVEQIINEKMKLNGFIYDDSNYDLAIAIGGDGSFLRMIKQTNFNSDYLSFVKL